VPCGPTQHLDPVDLAELVQARSGAAAIHAVDEHRDRAFETRIVADRTDTADAGRASWPRCPVEETSSDGASWLSWRMVGGARILQRLRGDRRPAIGTSDSGLARRVAVTMIVPGSASAPAAASRSRGRIGCGRRGPHWAGPSWTAPASVGVPPGVLGVWAAAAPLPALSCAFAGNRDRAAQQDSSPQGFRHSHLPRAGFTSGSVLDLGTCR
jgi:hypothetical protein